MESKGTFFWLYKSLIIFHEITQNKQNPCDYMEKKKVPPQIKVRFRLAKYRYGPQEEIFVKSKSIRALALYF